MCQGQVLDPIAAALAAGQEVLQGQFVVGNVLATPVAGATPLSNESHPLTPRDTAPEVPPRALAAEGIGECPRDRTWIALRCTRLRRSERQRGGRCPLGRVECVRSRHPGSLRRPNKPPPAGLQSSTPSLISAPATRQGALFRAYTQSAS